MVPGAGEYTKTPATFAVAFSCAELSAVPKVIAAGVAQVIAGVAFPTVYVTELGELWLPTASCDTTVNEWVPTVLSTTLLSGPVLAVAGKVLEPEVPHCTTPEPPSVQLKLAVTACPKAGAAGEIVGPAITGGFLSTSNGPNDPWGGWGADVFPATSLTVTAGMVALFVSVSAGTFV